MNIPDFWFRFLTNKQIRFIWLILLDYRCADTFLAWTDAEFQEFCKMYSKIKLPFWCQTRIETIEEDKFSMLKDIGLDRITFGLEHGNEDFRRDVVKREYSNEDAIAKMKIVKKKFFAAFLSEENDLRFT